MDAFIVMHRQHHQRLKRIWDRFAQIVSRVNRSSPDAPLVITPA
jgi:hypothetical protein